MKKKKSLLDGWSRRELLKSAGLGFCALCLSSIPGCSLEEKTEEQRVPEKEDGEAAVEQVLTQEKGLVKPRAASWFKQLDQARIQCQLCPKECQLESGERAPCRVRENRKGEGYTLAYGNPALIQEDPVERKPFFHVLPESRALSISTAGCNLDCKFCEVWDMALEDPENVYAHDVPPERVIQLARESNLRSVSYAFGEPVIFYEYMKDIANLAREKGLLNLMHTAGFIQPEPLKEIIGKMDAVNVDLKSFNPDFYREIVGGELEPVLENLKRMRDAGIHMEITNILIPSLNDDLEQISEMCTWIVQELGAGVPIHFARFYPLYKLSDLPRTPVSTLDQARDTALQAGLHYVYITRVTEHEGENTFCPRCREKIINRMGFVLEEILLEEGRCKFCDLEIPGIWG